MKWRGQRRSNNIEDRRSQRISGLGGAGGSGITRLLPAVFRLLGFKGTLIAVVGIFLFAFFTGNLQNLLAMIGVQTPTTASQSAQPVQQSTEEQQQVEFVSVVLADTEDTWSALFQHKGLTYKAPTLVLFRGAVKSACGMAQSAMGPFYCPADQQVYIDLQFYDQLKNQLNAPGDFAQAYVIAHEVGHHVQNLLGTSQKVYSAQRQASQKAANKLSVKQELQADCFAGIWAYYAGNTRQLLEAGDIEEALTAASAIGDDTLQRESTGVVRPDSFTHGTSAERMQWFKTGQESGDMNRCNTF